MMKKFYESPEICFVGMSEMVLCGVEVSPAYDETLTPPPVTGGEVEDIF